MILQYSRYMQNSIIAFLNQKYVSRSRLNCRRRIDLKFARYLRAVSMDRVVSALGVCIVF